MRGAARGVVDFLLPPACAGCGEALPTGSRGGRVCPRCRSRMRRLPHPRCPRCHAPRGTGLPADRPCPECAEWPDHLTWARSGFLLTEPASSLVHGLKYGGWPELAGEMAELLDPRELFPGNPDPDVPLVPIPTTPARERERGYNQARVLARALAGRTGRPVREGLVRREGGASQVALHPAERRENVLRAFRPHPDAGAWIGGASVILVDDVLTTGATATAAAQVLREAGAASVGLVTFARSLPGSDPDADPPGDSGVLVVPHRR